MLRRWCPSLPNNADLTRDQPFNRTLTYRFILVAAGVEDLSEGIIMNPLKMIDLSITCFTLVVVVRHYGLPMGESIDGRSA